MQVFGLHNSIAQPSNLIKKSWANDYDWSRWPATVVPQTDKLIIWDIFDAEHPRLFPDEDWLLAGIILIEIVCPCQYHSDCKHGDDRTTR